MTHGSFHHASALCGCVELSLSLWRLANLVIVKKIEPLSVLLTTIAIRPPQDPCSLNGITIISTLSAVSGLAVIRRHPNDDVVDRKTRRLCPAHGKSHRGDLMVPDLHSAGS